MREIRIIEEGNGIEVVEWLDDRERGVLLTERMDTLDFHLAKNAIRVYGEMITRYQEPTAVKVRGK